MYNRYVNTREGVEYVQKKTRAWLDLRLSLMGALTSFFVIVMAIYTPEDTIISKVDVAVALNSSLAIPLLLAFMIGILSEAERLLQVRNYVRSIQPALVLLYFPLALPPLSLSPLSRSRSRSRYSPILTLTPTPTPTPLPPLLSVITVSGANQTLCREFAH